MTRWQTLVDGLILYPSSVALAEDNPLTLAEEGMTTFEILTPDDPSLEEQTAATWLSETLEQISGVKIPVRAAARDDLVHNAPKFFSIEI